MRPDGKGQDSREVKGKKKGGTAHDDSMICFNVYALWRVNGCASLAKTSLRPAMNIWRNRWPDEWRDEFIRRVHHAAGWSARPVSPLKISKEIEHRAGRLVL